ncbi:MAG: hypothetical protein IME93_03175 [Proteobacteria bacterium]|nr:hypothetical protein [Pseudomonadota bacterium]
MTHTAESICSTALRKLGDNPITNLTDDSNRARLCNAFWEGIRDSVLRAYPWNSAMARAQLAELSTAPDFEFSAQYLMPSDCLMVRKLYDYTDKWKVEGRNILTMGSGELNIVYTKRETDTSLYDALLAEALSARMASELSEPITQNVNLSQFFYTRYKEVLAEARSMDAQESSVDEFESGDLTTVR